MTELFDDTPEVSETIETNDPIATIKAKFSKEDGSVDVDALLAAKAESDRFIDQLQGEGKGLREELTKRTSLDDLMARLDQGKSSEDKTVNHTDTAKNDDIPNRAVDQRNIEQLVEQVYTKKNKEASQLKNISDVRSQLEQAWGKDFPKKLKQMTDELDISQEEAGRLAGEKPKAFLKLVLGDNQRQPQHDTAPPVSSVRLTSSTVVGGKNYTHFKKMMDSPDARIRNQYWSPKVQNEMHKLAQQLGDAFYN